MTFITVPIVTFLSIGQVALAADAFASLIVPFLLPAALLFSFTFSFFFVTSLSHANIHSHTSQLESEESRSRVNWIADVAVATDSLLVRCKLMLVSSGDSGSHLSGREVAKMLSVE